MTKLFFINEAHTEGLLLLILCLFYQTSREEIYSLIIKVISDFFNYLKNLFNAQKIIKILYNPADLPSSQFSSQNE